MKQANNNPVRITAVRQTVYTNLMAQYENKIEHACDVKIGQQWISANGKRPEGMCPSAWESMREFVEELSKGGGNFFDGWMQNPKSAMISCNDGFRPVSFYIETIE
ncbi:MAG: TIGR04076 family protein [Bacteroidales bacterium]|nr:TIGR04076 family protein [Bacteroidales bacterium]